MFNCRGRVANENVLAAGEGIPVAWSLGSDDQVGGGVGSAVAVTVGPGTGTTVVEVGPGTGTTVVVEVGAGSGATTSVAVASGWG